MARVLALVPDLLFGSNLQGTLTAAGNDVEMLGGEAALRERLGDEDAPAAHVLVVDLTDPDLDGSGILAALLAEGELTAIHTLGYYSHVDALAREHAEEAGFELVVPRSRMAREGASLIARLAR